MKPTGSEGALVSLRAGEMLAVARPCALRVVRVVDASCEITAVGYFKQEERKTYQGRGCGSEGTEAFFVALLYIEGSCTEWFCTGTVRL